MAAATAKRSAERKLSDLVAYKVPAAGTVFGGTLVSVRIADGFLYPSRSGTASDIFVGVARDTSKGNGVAGGINCRVEKSGTFLFTLTGAAQTDIGVAVYASDDSTVTKTSTNNQLVGYVEELVATDTVRVRIDRAVN